MFRKKSHGSKKFRYNGKSSVTVVNYDRKWFINLALNAVKIGRKNTKQSFMGNSSFTSEFTGSKC